MSGTQMLLPLHGTGLVPAGVTLPGSPLGVQPPRPMAPIEVQNLRAVAPSGLATFETPAITPLSVGLSLAGAALGAWHFTKRHRGSAGWGFVGALAGAMFPVVVPVIAVAQGFGEPLPKKAGE